MSINMGTERFLVAVGNYDEAVDSAGNIIDNNVSADTCVLLETLR